MHEQIARVLRDRISTGVYSVDEMLPPEMLLVAEFKASRHTVREAMKTLVNERLIERVPGRGTVVRPRYNEEKWGIRSLNDLVGEFNQSQIVVLKRANVSSKSYPQVADIFSLRGATSTLFHIERVMNSYVGPMALHNLFTLPRYAKQLPADQIGHVPLIGQIEEHCNVRAARTRQVATAESADARVSKMLGVRVGTPMLILRRTYLDQDGNPIEYTELICRPDRYQHTIDFLRESV